MNVTLRRLRYFVAVAEQLSFTRAAELMHVSQPSLSAQVGALEQGLGVALLRRTTRRVELTEAGEVMLEDARGILSDVERACARAVRAGRASGPELRIVYTASAGYEALPLVLAEIEERAPRARVHADRLPSAQVVAEVASGRAELGLVRAFTGADGIESETIRHEALWLFVSERHRLSGRAAVSLDELAGETVVVVPRSLASGFRDVVEGLLSRRRIEPALVEMAAPENRESLFAHLARHEQHAFIGPASTESAAWPGVVGIPIADSDARLSLSALWPSSERSPVVATALEAAREIAGREGWLAEP